MLTAEHARAVPQTAWQTLGLRRPPSRVVVRAPNWIGDAVMSEPAMRRVRDLFPGASITLLARPAVGDLFHAHPAFDRFIPYWHRGRHAGWAGKWTLAGDLRRDRFDLAVLFQNAFEAAALTWLAGIPARLGYSTDGRGWLLTAARRPAYPEAHQVQYYLRLLEGLGPPTDRAHPMLHMTRDEEEDVQRRLAAWGVQAGTPLIGLNPGSVYGTAKRWLPERFAAAADRLAADYHGCVVIVGGPGEEQLGSSIAGMMKSRPLVLSGQTSMRQLMALIKQCRVFLTNDTGPMHIAAAFGVPVVAIFGPTDARTTSPVGDRHRIVRTEVECSPCLLRVCPIDHRCMVRVTVDDVVAAAQTDLGSPPAVPAAPGATAETAFPPAQPVATHDTRGPLEGFTVFLDRDGTLNRDTGYVRTPAELEILPGVPEGIAALSAAGCCVVIVTNQSGVARGYFTLADLKAVHGRLCEAVERAGGRIDAIYFCPHHPDERCSCRKPEPGMVHRAEVDLGVDLSRSYLVGDQPRDVKLARAVGARAILVLTGQSTAAAINEPEAAAWRPDYVADDLRAAVTWIVEDAHQRIMMKA